MSGDQLYYYLHTPGGRVALDGTFAPTGYRMTQTSSNLVRARGYRDMIDLSDGLPDPVPFQLSGEIRFRSESELSLALTELNTLVRSATAVSRDERAPIPISGASLYASPPGRNSGVAAVTLTFIPAEVPDPNVVGHFF